ncbi:AAEL002548-PA, partial [Aedes aegypti]
REPWFAHYMMDYFGQTSSIRVVDILVKVQTPHDKFILDKLTEWIRSGSNKMLALTLFGHIIQKRPTWLYKVGNHLLVKEVLKQSKMEREIIPLISAVLCIIDLLPVIPLVMGMFVQDLFEIFNYLATFDRNTSVSLPEDQLIHLQFVLYELFNRLYGMYPCNFVMFLKQEYRGDKQAVFQHTIKPLLGTVKIHPRLVSSDKESEINQVRWRNMEPHDVVSECARMSLDYMGKPQEIQNNQLIGSECPCYATPMKPVEFNAMTATIDLQWKATVNYFNKSSTDEKLSTIAVQNSFWSPSNMMQPTPPPGPATVPHTPNPTPSYTIPSISGPLLPAADGASPPEAAVEATPETTPMKDIVKPIRPYPMNSGAVRAILNTSQPSSPIKKESTSHFNFNEKSIITSQKLLRMVNDRNHSVMQISSGNSNTTITTTTATSTTSNSVPSNQPQQQLQPPTAPVQHPMKEAFDAEDFEQEEGSPCSAGGLHFKSSQSMINFTRKRYRMHSQCLVDSDPSYSTGTSPADTSNYMLKNSVGISATRSAVAEALKKHQRRHSLPDLKKYSLRHIRRNMALFQEIRKNLTNLGAHRPAQIVGPPVSQLVSSGTQTIESYPQPYEQIIYGILQEEQKFKADIAMDPNAMLDKYIELCVKKRLESEEMYRDHIKLLNLQLQFEKHRREIHAERNRRLLGKSRVIRALEQNNDALKDQVSRLTKEISSLSTELASLRRKTNMDWTKNSTEVVELKERYAAETRKNQDLQLKIKELEIALNEDTRTRKEQTVALEQARGELFDMTNEMEQALHKADLGQQYRDELTRLQCEMILMGEIQLKCKERLAELDSLKARDAEIAMIQETYQDEVKDLKLSLEMKSSQLDSAKERLTELEQQLMKRDETITLQKRMLKTVKEEHKEQFNALERKYHAQKAIVVKMEEAILELRVNAVARSPDSDRTDAVGSLDHTSPLSISLASSEGLS